MSFLSGIFSNDAVKNAAFGMLKKHMKENGKDFGKFWIKEDGNIDVEFYSNKEQIMIDRNEYEELRRIYLEYLKNA